MPSNSSLGQLLDRLEAAKREFGTPGQEKLLGLLEALGRRRFTDAHSLIRFHEALLFFRAYAPDEEVLRLTESLLGSFCPRVDRLGRSGGDLTPFEEPDVSGVSGTSFSAIFSYDIARWLAGRHPREVEIDWDASEPELLAPLLYRLHPFFAEDGLVEANIPYLDWFRAAKKGRESDLGWLMSEIERLKIPHELYDHARLPLLWHLGNGPTTRTNLRLAGRAPFFHHDGPLIRRSEVSLAAELEAPPFPLEKQSRAQGERMLDLVRDTSAMRYRELHGFTYGDPARVVRTNFGRGVQVFVADVAREHRLPLRTYHAGMFFKNGVPIGYIECLTFAGRMEVGFNLYYTFREGETAWLYAKLLRLFRQLLDVQCFSVDPYQIGLHNDEAIESGAFWFYRKLGFRPTNAKVAKLLEREEGKLRSDSAYRTSPGTLRRLAEGWMVYEVPGAPKGKWDKFDVRRLAMARGTKRAT